MSEERIAGCQKIVCRVLRRVVTAHPLRLCEIERRGGISSGYLSKLLAGERISFEQLERVLEVLQVPAADFFDRLRLVAGEGPPEGVASGPAKVVAASLRQAFLGGERQPAEAGSEEHLRGLLTYCPPSALGDSFAQDPRWRSLPAVSLACAHLQDVLQHDPAAAIGLGLALVRGAAVHTRRGCEAVAEVARVLMAACRTGGWLSTGEQIAAAVWWPMLPLSPALRLRWDLLVGGQWLTRGNAEKAAEVGRAAASRALAMGDFSRLTVSLLLQANSCHFAARTSAALPFYALAIDACPVTEYALRSAGHRLYAVALSKVGETSKATAQWRRAVELGEEWPLVQGHLAWTGAELAYRRGEFERARQGFKRALRHLSEISLLDAALLTVDLVETLLALGAHREAGTRAREMASVLMVEESNSLIEGAILELSRIAEAQELTQAAIDHARELLQRGRCRGLPARQLKL